MLQLALRGNKEARQGLADSAALASQAGQLAANVSQASDRVTSLEGVTTGNTEVITMATETAETAISDASSLQTEVEQLIVSHL